MQSEDIASNDEAKKTGVVQEMIYEIIRADLEVMTNMTNKAKTAKSRFAAKYYGKKAAKAKGKVVNALKFAERFSKVKEEATALDAAAPAE